MKHSLPVNVVNKNRKNNVKQTFKLEIYEKKYWIPFSALCTLTTNDIQR